jgi:hypothetical protein
MEEREFEIVDGMKVGRSAQLEAGGSPFDFAQDKQTRPYDLASTSSIRIFLPPGVLTRKKFTRVPSAPERVAG